MGRDTGRWAHGPTRRTARLVHLVVLFALVAFAAWPAFVAVSTLLAMGFGEARQLDAWALEPKRALLAHFLEGWGASLPVAAAVGVVAVVDYLLLSRHRATWLIGGILLPVAGAALAFAFYPDPATALPALATTGLALAVLYRVFEGLRQRLAGGQ